MNTFRTSILALLTSCLALAPTSYASDGPASEAAIVKASKSHAGSVKATAQFQKSQSQQAAASLINAVQSAEPSPETVEPAAGSSLFEAAPPVRQQAFTVKNELAPAAKTVITPAKTAASRPAAPISRYIPAYNQ